MGIPSLFFLFDWTQMLFKPSNTIFYFLFFGELKLINKIGLVHILLYSIQALNLLFVSQFISKFFQKVNFYHSFLTQSSSNIMHLFYVLKIENLVKRKINTYFETSVILSVEFFFLGLMAGWKNQWLNIWARSRRKASSKQWSMTRSPEWCKMKNKFRWDFTGTLIKH